MSVREVSNNPASVRQRLLMLARERGEDFQQLLVRFALERLLYRLGVSPHADQFILKGALLFQLWFSLTDRPTRDADFLGFGAADPQRLTDIFADLARLENPQLAEDGLRFDAASVRAEAIREAAGYPGIRITLQATLDGARIPVQCDIGFGDAVTPEATREELRTLLPLPPPTLRVYPPETVVAEKLEAIVRFAGFNSRMKDYFDLWVLFTHGTLEATQLPAALRATFDRRGTAIPEALPEGMSDDFVQARLPMWRAFVTRNGLEAPPFAAVMADLRARAQPLFAAARALGR
jgi:predicted nucleotidyltransferase component of viral defense system